MQITVLTNLVPPYRFDAYNALHRLAFSAGGGLSVICTQQTEPQRKWRTKAGNFDQYLLSGLHFPLEENRVFSLPFNVRDMVQKTSPQVLLLNGFGIAQWQAQNHARKHSIPGILQFDGWTGSDETYANPVRFRLRKHMITRAAGFIAASTRGAEWFHALGAPQQDIRIAPIPGSFELTEDHQTQTDWDLLWCGRTTWSKGFDVFLSVARILLKAGKIKRIGIIGCTNPEATTAELRANGLHDHTDTYPQVSQDELPALISRGRLCLFPSRNDAYGVGVIDAICCGAVALASPEVGCATDVLGPDEILPITDPDVWASTCQRLLEKPDLLAETRSRQRKRTANNTAEHHARTTWQTALSVLEADARQPVWI